MSAPASDALVLGIESSCDETAAAVVRGGRTIVSSIVHSQIEEHRPFGGVVPEIAGRSHLRHVSRVVDTALDEAGVTLDDLSAIAVTTRPGLIGSLLVGVGMAKGLAFAHGLDLVGVHHIEAHAYAAAMEHDLEFPAVALVVSGGHTALYQMDEPTRLTHLASTLDDAAGEAFDKVAHMLGLAYPGGPSIAALAEGGDRSAIPFPRHRPKKGGLGFSFSGLKTAVLYHLKGGDALAPLPIPEELTAREDVAASFQEAVVDALIRQTLLATEQAGVSTCLITGGVACNGRLREKLIPAAAAQGVRAVFPSPALCGDNAAMIAGLGYHRWAGGELASWDLDASARA